MDTQTRQNIWVVLAALVWLTFASVILSFYDKSLHLRLIFFGGVTYLFIYTSIGFLIESQRDKEVNKDG